MNEAGFSLADFWNEGGLWMFPVLLVGLVAVVSAAFSVAARNHGLALAALLSSQLPLGLGAAGWAWNRRVVDQALAMVNPEDLATLMAAGYAEALRPLQLGGALWALSTPLALVALVLSRRRGPADPAPR